MGATAEWVVYPSEEEAGIFLAKLDRSIDWTIYCCQSAARAMATPIYPCYESCLPKRERTFD